MSVYKGRGEHSVSELEAIIEQLLEELHLYKSEQKKFTDKDMDNAYDKGFHDAIGHIKHR